MIQTTTKWREVRIRKTADWLLSWVYDATTGDIYTGHDHINIIPEIPNGMEKAMEGNIICGWWVKDYGDNEVTTRIATDTVEQGLADKKSPIAEKAQKAAMKYWHDSGLDDEYGTSEEYCPHCDQYYDPEYENHEEDKCYQCGEWYYPCDMYEDEKHSMPYCPECDEHVDDLEEHNKDYHFEPEPWMPKEESEVEYQGKPYFVYDVNMEGMDLVPVMPGHTWPQFPYKGRIQLTWDEWKKYQEQQKGLPELHPEQTTLENQYPGWIEPKWVQGVPTTPPPYWNSPSGKSIAHIADLHDKEVFAKLSSDYLRKLSDNYMRNEGDSPYDSALQAEQNGYNKNNWMDWDDFENLHDKGEDIYQGLVTEPTEQETTFTPPTQDDPSADVSLPDNPQVIEIARDWDSDEYRWSYDGQQLHMWRVFNRGTYGPSHYDMFGHEGYSNHSQGRVYVSPSGKVGMLYWQITHPECERVCNEWSLKTFGKLPDYTYRAYGPYQGRPVSRFDFPIVEVGGLPIRQHERWWEQPGGYPGMKTTQPDYPAQKQKKKKRWLQSVPGPVDDQGQPVTPGKSKRRKRTRNRKYRNRSFRR